MTRYPTLLHFDSSGSASFVPAESRVASVRVHWKEGIPQNFLVCPESVGMLGKKCHRCASGELGDDRSVAYVYDLYKSKRCLLMSSPTVFAKIARLGLDGGILLQRTGMKMLADRIPLPESFELSELSEGPPFEDYLAGLESRSVWAKRVEK